jgi:hypothetical protein
MALGFFVAVGVCFWIVGREAESNETISRPTIEPLSQEAIRRLVEIGLRAKEK